MFLCFNLSMFTEEDGTNINNEDRKELQIRKNAKIYPIFQPLKSSRKSVFVLRALRKALERF